MGIKKIIYKIEELIYKIGYFLICKDFVEREIKKGIEYYGELKATIEEINSFETEFNIILPEDFKECYINGKKGYEKLIKTSYSKNYFIYMPIDKMKSIKNAIFDSNIASKEFKINNSKIKPYLSNKKWYPFAQEEHGLKFLVLDYDPTLKGKMGQIVLVDHFEDVFYIASTFSELLEDDDKIIKKEIEEEIKIIEKQKKYMATTSHNRTVCASPPYGGSGSAKRQSG